jgi:hypothetical protein
MVNYIAEFVVDYNILDFEKLIINLFIKYLFDFLFNIN